MTQPHLKHPSHIIPPQVPVLPPRSRWPHAVGFAVLSLTTFALIFSGVVYAAPSSLYSVLQRVPFFGPFVAQLPHVAGSTTTHVQLADSQNPFCPPQLSLVPPPGSDVKPLPAGYNNITTTKGNVLKPGIYQTSLPISITGTLNIEGAVSIYAPSINVSSSGKIVADNTGNPGGTSGKLYHNEIAKTYTGTYATSGIGYCLDGTPGCPPDSTVPGKTANPTGGGGTRAFYQAPDGAGGGGYGGAGGDGSNPTKEPGGFANWDLPGVDAYNIRMGSGGGGGYCNNGDQGCRAGDGGGSIALYASNIVMAGGITAHGQNAKDVPIPDPADGYVIAGGGGGAGGGILISGSIVNITGTLKVHGGDGADSCYVEAQCPADDDAGAGGGGGTIKVFYDPTAGTSVVPTDAQVDYGGGAPGRQVRGNKPTAGSGGYFHSWPCTPVVSHNQCDASHFQFNMPTYDQNFVPGARLFYGVSLGLNGFNGKTATIQHTLDPIEDNGQQKFVLSYGDWHGAQFQTTQGSYYKACFKHRAGADFPGELSNSFVDLGTQNAGMFSVNLFSSSTQTEQKLRESIVALPGGWTNNSIAFQAPSTGQSYLTFRTGSFRQGWFTGSLDLDNVGVLPCASNDPTCQNVSCDAVSTSANLVGASGSTQSQDATFDSNNDPTSVWLHSSAAPNINDASTKAHLRDPDNNGYLQIQSKNYFEQSVTPCPSGAAHCYQWTGTVQLASADFQLYSIAVILAQNLCGGDFVHSGYANVDPNDANCSRSDSKTASLNMCPGQPPQADVIGPLTVCANQDATFSATVSHPDPSVDSHQYEWYTKQAGPNTPAPTINPEGYQLIGSDVGTVVAGTINSDQMQIPMNFILGVRVKSSSSTFPPVFSEKTVRVIRCSNEPSEDVHAGGRAIINPPPGTADTKKNVLKWLEIPAWLP